MWKECGIIDMKRGWKMKRVRLNKELKCASVPFWSTDKSEMYQAVIDLNDENTDAENGMWGKR